MTTQQLEQTIQELNPGFSIVENPNRPGLSNIFFNGVNYDLPVVSSTEVKEEVDQNYRYEFPNGHSARHHTSEEVLSRLKVFLEQFETIKKEYED